MAVMITGNRLSPWSPPDRRRVELQTDSLRVAP